MIDRGDCRGQSPDEAASSLFQKQWQTYRKIVDNNYTFHRDTYGALHRILVDEAAQPFRLLDIACGDASATVNALKGTRIAHYHGIDLSQTALDLARTARYPAQSSSSGAISSIAARPTRTGGCRMDRFFTTSSPLPN